jgi:fructokinase
MLEKEEAARGRVDSLTKDDSELPDSSAIIVGLGELIWDLLPAGKQLGGAPANFAYISCLLGNESIVASRIGADDPGREALARLEQMNVSTRYLQIDASHPTGTVRVELDARGEARFAMNEDSAWDYLEWTESWGSWPGVRTASASARSASARFRRAARSSVSLSRRARAPCASSTLT